MKHLTTGLGCSWCVVRRRNWGHRAFDASVAGLEASGAAWEDSAAALCSGPVRGSMENFKIKIHH